MTGPRILTVCTGNICRSPFAELGIAAGLDGVAPAAVASAGTGALVGEGLPEPMRVRATAMGLPRVDDHRARQLTSAMVEEADLILPLAREHRRRIVELAPSAVSRTFTLREFARLTAELTDDELAEAAAVPADDLGGRLRVAARAIAPLRGIFPPTNEADDDVVDPYRRDEEVYDRSVAQLAPAIDQAVAFLRRLATIERG